MVRLLEEWSESSTAGALGAYPTCRDRANPDVVQAAAWHPLLSKALLIGTAMAAPVGLLTAADAGLSSLVAAAAAGVIGAAIGLAVGRRRPKPEASLWSSPPTDWRIALEIAVVLVRRPNGVILQWSAGATRLFGYSAAEAVGRVAHELLRTRFAEGGRRTAEAEVLRSGRWQGELRHRCRDGRVVTVAATWALRSSSPGAEPWIVEACTEATALKIAEEELRASEGRLRLAQEVAEIGTWEWKPDTDEQEWSREQHALFGTDPDLEPRQTVERLLALAHPEDRPRLRSALARAEETGEYEAEFRIRRRSRTGIDETRWLIGRGRRMPGPAGQRGALLGMHVDITARKEAEMRQTLLIREVDHRAKNALAVVQAVLRLTRAPDQDSFVKAVEGRVAALARAQTLLTRSRWSGADLSALLEGELAPFLAAGALGPSVTLEGPPVMLAPIITQPLSMSVHELATNAMKHGALSCAGGHVQIRWRVREGERRHLLLEWEETGGPPVSSAPFRLGFGSRVLRTTVRDQLNGTLEQHWTEAGLRCVVEIPLPDSQLLGGAPGEDPSCL